MNILYYNKIEYILYLLLTITFKIIKYKKFLYY